uniref:UDP-N-acetylglucosamine transferase subunit ALG13 n=1 Tax=Anolis carolinensis TaxID=28377 RepID=A0A803TZN5_ANOCA
MRHFRCLALTLPSGTVFQLRISKGLFLAALGSVYGFSGKVLQDLGYRKLVLQVGRGSVCPDPFSTNTFTLEVFRFKNSLTEEVQAADLVISHAGAGSCLEVLEAGKPLLVVVNDKLMDNHQLELARQLHRDGHLFYCSSRDLVETLRSMDLSTLKPFPRGQPEKFAEFLDKAIGI